MKELSGVLFLLVTLFSCFLTKIDDGEQWDFDDNTVTSISEVFAPTFAIEEGIVCDSAATLRILRGEEALAIVRLGEPVVVDQAEADEPWGYYQFPAIYRNKHDDIIVKFSMKSDDISAYGVPVTRRNMMVSKDEGKTWIPLDDDYFELKRTRAELRNGLVPTRGTPFIQRYYAIYVFP